MLDDWLGIWGDVALTGKSAESDLVSGKKTLPVLYGLAQDGQFARRWMQGKVSADEAPALARMLEEAGASAYTLETAGRLTGQAVSALQAAVSHSQTGGGEVDSRAREASLALEELTDKLLKRKN